MITARDDRRRTFETVPAGAAAVSWWGRAWVSALEEVSGDPARLARGRGYATDGHVDAVTVTPGRIVAYVRGSRPRPYRTELTLPAFADAEWGELLEDVAADPAALGALLEREVPQSLAGTVLPGAGELVPHCSCPDVGRPPCKHAAALCYRAARLLDEDPFVLLLLRGRGERQLLDGLEARSAANAPAQTPDADVAADAGVPADLAYGAARAGLPPLPPLPELPRAPGQPPTLDTEAEPDGPDVDAVEFLAQAAAAEAFRLLAEAVAPGHADRAVPAAPTQAQDAVRLTREADDVRVRSRLAVATGRSRADMELAVLAWGFGAAPGLAALEDDWTPDRTTLARARTAWAAAWAEEEAPVLRRVRARWTSPATGRQIRLGREGRWWPYRREAGRWIPSGPPAPDPASALAAADPAD
ncbi:SWIM zinc finger family protein [Streptomyces sp. WAC05950]|uniref:SWIM zinc finger family protein n=1 Tax=Streptomyces sp. WAC05950 TaxID=2487419 RepID=UPI000F738370|nr:SWIM zinc finger family protein [Streptomyces sp. WAC05950]RSS95319.1 hypothetical protein EF904_28695 [Streptomyces sp. WAC05950]